MPRLIARAGEHHRPGHVAHPPDHFRIDEIGDPPEEQSERRRRRGNVAERQRIDALDAGEQIDREHDAEQPAMERHAAMPHRGDLGRVLPEIARLVEQHEAEPAADHDAEGDPEQEIVGLRDRQRRLAAPKIGLRHEPSPIQPAEQDAGHIGQPIPADRDRPEFDRDGIDHRVGDDKEFHAGSACVLAGGPDPSPPSGCCQGAERPLMTGPACAVNTGHPIVQS